MDAIRLYLRENPEWIERVMDGECSDDDRTLPLSNVPDPNVFWRYKRRSRPHEMSTPTMLIEVTLDIPVDVLCHEYEVDPCLGKERRFFWIPYSIIQHEARLRSLPDSFNPETVWNIYPEIATPADKSVRSTIQTPLTLIGDDQTDLGDLPELLEEHGFQTRTSKHLCDGDAVLFCISCADGPTAGTLKSVSACAGRQIRPLAIIQTNFQLLDDDSLISLVTAEERELLARIIPRERIDQLPLWIGGDPYMPDKLRTAMSISIDEFLCYTTAGRSDGEA